MGLETSMATTPLSSGRTLGGVRGERERELKRETEMWISSGSISPFLFSYISTLNRECINSLRVKK